MASVPPAFELVPGDSWHPLSGQQAPQYVPPSWIGPHVGLRLVEALRVLRRVPMNGHPREFGNSWPQYAIKFSERSQYEDDEEWKRDQASERNQIRPRPSSVEISRMELAIGWPIQYLRDLPQLLSAVQSAAFVRARHQPLERAARYLKLPGRVVRRWNREGLDLIAAGLRRDAVAVF
jgi:hypothetical protein